MHEAAAEEESALSVSTPGAKPGEPSSSEYRTRPSSPPGPKGSLFRLESSRSRHLVLLFGICAFMAILAAVDTAQYLRAWRAAITWTIEQKTVAPAMDAPMMHRLVFASLAFNTVVIACSASGALCLGIAIALESPRLLTVVHGLLVGSLFSGCTFSTLLVLYFTRLAPRFVLKGPVFDYDMRLQPTVAIAMLAFPVITFIVILFWRRQLGMQQVLTVRKGIER